MFGLCLTCVHLNNKFVCEGGGLLFLVLMVVLCAIMHLTDYLPFRWTKSFTWSHNLQQPVAVVSIGLALAWLPAANFRLIGSVCPKHAGICFSFIWHRVGIRRYVISCFQYTLYDRVPELSPVLTKCDCGCWINKKLCRCVGFGWQYTPQIQWTPQSVLNRFVMNSCSVACKTVKHNDRVWMQKYDFV